MASRVLKDFNARRGGKEPPDAKQRYLEMFYCSFSSIDE